MDINATQAFVIGITVFILFMDVFLLKNRLSSFSMEIARWALQWTFVPMFAGILMGHWFITGIGYVGSLSVVVPVLLANIGYDLAWHKWGKKEKVWFRHPAVHLALGVPIGFLFWTQSG
jgi:hypothetical protein